MILSHGSEHKGINEDGSERHFRRRVCQCVSERGWNMVVTKEAMEEARKVSSVLLGERGRKGNGDG